MRKKPKEAAAILLSANLVYRCIKMWLDLYQWDQALEVAVRNQRHVDTVLYFREKYLSSWGQKEVNPRFMEHMSTKVDWEDIKTRIEMELENERHGRPIV